MNLKIKKGFTLIELLIVIAILGTLAVVVLVALNPVQQLARTRDAGRLSTITQMGHAMQALGTTRGGTYPSNGTGGDCRGSANTGATWVTNCLVNGGELAAPGPSNPSYGTAPTYTCGAGHANQGGWCYVGNSAGGTIYTTPEANANTALCGTGNRAFFAYNTVDGRGGVLCVGGTNFPSASAGAGGTWNQ